MNVTELLRKACLGIVCMTMFTGVIAQDVPPSLDKLVHVPVKKVDINTLGDIITAQTGLILSFNAQKITAQKQLQLRRSSYSICQLLSMIEKATCARYTIYREHVIFHRITGQGATTPAITTGPVPPATRRPAVPGSGQQRTGTSTLSGRTGNKPSLLSGNHSALPPARSSNDSIYRNGISADRTNKKTGKPVNIPSAAEPGPQINNTAGNSEKADTRQVVLSYIVHPTTASPFAAIKPAAPTLLPVASPVQQQKRKYTSRKPGLFKPFVLAGVGADEIFYANLQAKAGVTLLYGIAGWSSDFSISGFRYGAGSSYPLKNGWTIQLEATTGQLSKETAVRMAFDSATTRLPFRMNVRLQRISLFGQKNITPHWSIYAGPVFNRLKSTYYLNSGQISREYITRFIATPEKEYAAVRPPYTLSETPPGELKNIRTWIGLQTGINYRF